MMAGLPSPTFMRAVYVAAATEEAARAKKVMAAIRDRGGVITADWTVDVEANLGKTDAELTPAERTRFAIKDLGGLLKAEVVLVLTPEDKRNGCGLWIEMGYALAYGRRMILTGEQRNRSVFCEQCERYDSDEEAIDACFLFPGSSR